jgi:hypothetical protein
MGEHAERERWVASGYNGGLPSEIAWWEARLNEIRNELKRRRDNENHYL